MFFFFSSFFIVYLWSLGAKFSLIFFWNGVRFVFREDFFRNYNFFSSNGEIYECGFSGVEEPLKKIEVQYLILSIFFIIYEIEFLILLPFFFKFRNYKFYNVLNNNFFFFFNFIFLLIRVGILFVALYSLINLFYFYIVKLKYFT